MPKAVTLLVHDGVTVFRVASRSQKDRHNRHHRHAVAPARNSFFFREPSLRPFIRSRSISAPFSFHDFSRRAL